MMATLVQFSTFITPLALLSFNCAATSVTAALYITKHLFSYNLPLLRD